MRILHVISALHTGGAQRLLIDLLPRQKSTGDDVEILVFKKLNNSLECKLLSKGIRIHSLNVENEYSPFNCLVLKDFFRSFQAYDIVHVHLFPALYITGIVRNCVGAPLVYTEHSSTNRRRKKSFLRGLERWIYSRYAALIAVSEQSKHTLSKWIGRKLSKRIHVIENGIDISRFTPRKLSKIVAVPVIVMVARFTPAKDHATLVRAISKMQHQEAVLWLVGEGETRQDIEILVRELGISERVVFMGERNDVESLLEKADIGVLSSHWEGHNISIAEMMATGLPVVASDIEGIRAVGGRAPLYFKEGEIKVLSGHLDNLLKDPELYEERRNLSLQQVQKVDISSVVHNYQVLYRDLTS